MENKEKMSFLTLLSNITPDVLANSIGQEIEIKGIHTEKEETKLSLFTDDVVVYIENPKKYKKNTHVTELSKFIGYKANI